MELQTYTPGRLYLSNRQNVGVGEDGGDRGHTRGRAVPSHPSQRFDTGFEAICSSEVRV